MRKFINRAVSLLLLPIIIFLIVLAYTSFAKNFYFPSLVLVLRQFVKIWFGSRFFHDVVPSLRRLALGYLIAVAAGVLIGLILGSYAPVRRAAEPVLEFFRALPPPAIIPIFILLIGFGDIMKIAVIVTGAVWPILLNTVEGVKAFDPVLDETCRVYGIRGWHRLREFILPGALPQIVAGMRIGLSIALILMIIGEMFAASNGIGAAIIIFQQAFALPQMWSGVLVLGLLGFALSVLFAVFERRVLRWYHGQKNFER